jgi:putative transcriptional regulator
VKLGNNLKRCRFDRGDMTQENLANAVGVTRQTILSIEKGKYIPSTLLAMKLAKFFNKSVENIFFITDVETSEGEKNEHSS